MKDGVAELSIWFTDSVNDGSMAWSVVGNWLDAVGDAVGPGWDDVGWSTVDWDIVGWSTVDWNVVGSQSTGSGLYVTTTIESSASPHVGQRGPSPQ